MKLPHKTPTYSNGTPFYGYSYAGTDYTSAGEAYAKFIDSAQKVYSFPQELMGNQYIINQTVFNNAEPIVSATYEKNREVHLLGKPLQTSSSPLATFSNYNSNLNSVKPQNQNPMGCRHNFIRSKDRVPAYVKNGQVDINAMKNTFRPTNGEYFIDTLRMELITEGLYGSPRHNYIAMPRHPKYPDKDVTIQLFHNYNTNSANFPSSEIVYIIRNILPKINQQGYNTYDDAVRARTMIAQSAKQHSTQILVEDFIIVQLGDKYYILPSF